MQGTPPVVHSIRQETMAADIERRPEEEECHWIDRLVPLGLLLAALMPLPAAAQEAYPSRPVTLVTPYAAGGGSDVVTRVLADELRRQLGQPVTVQNITGAGGNIGAQRVAQAAPDGYTLLLHHVGMATAPALFKAPDFDPVKSFEPVGMFADIPMLLVANGTSRQATWRVARLGAQAGRCGDVRLLRPGQRDASLRHHVPATRRRQCDHGAVSGSRPSTRDLGGPRPSAVRRPAGRFAAGEVRCHQGLRADRHPPAGEPARPPDHRRVGLQAMDVSLWYGLYAPAGTPRAIVDRLAVALQGATASPRDARTERDGDSRVRQRGGDTGGAAPEAEVAGDVVGPRDQHDLTRLCRNPRP